MKLALAEWLTLRGETLEDVAVVHRLAGDAPAVVARPMKRLCCTSVRATSLVRTAYARRSSDLSEDAGLCARRGGCYGVRRPCSPSSDSEPSTPKGVSRMIEVMIASPPGEPDPVLGAGERAV